MDFPRGRGSSGKIVEFPGGGGEYGQTLWNGKSRGVGGQTGKTLRGGGYGYFLEPHDFPFSVFFNHFINEQTFKYVNVPDCLLTNFGI